MGTQGDHDVPDRMVGDLFAEEPEQWGLRGDPYAWAAIRDHLATTPIPTDPAKVEPLLKDAFRAVVGEDPDDRAAPETVYRDEFAHGGMSSGAVHLPTWSERLIPLLITRAHEAERARSRAAMKELADLQNELGLTE